MVPDNLSLFYWDYYTQDEKTFRHMAIVISSLKPMIFAGGAWKWCGMTPLNFFCCTLTICIYELPKKNGAPW